MQALLAVDAGSTAVKVTAFDASLSVLAQAGREVAVAPAGAARVEFDVEAYWRAVADAVRQAAGMLPRGCTPVALAISSHTDTLIAVDFAGRLVRPGIFWYDGRAEAQARAMAGQFPQDLFHRTTGQPAPSAILQAAKIRWLADEEPDALARAAHLLQTCDYLGFRMTGRAALDLSIACCGGLVDVPRRRYWPEMLAWLGVPEDRLPELVEPGRPVAPLRPEAAREMGLPPGVLLVAGAMDQTAAALACGCTAPGVVSECTGAALAVSACVDELTCDPQRVVPCCCHAVPGRYLLMPYSPTGGMALRWFRDRFWRPTGGEEGADDGYRAMTSEAAAVPAGSDGLAFVPHLAGGGPPDFDPNARAIAYGMTLEHTRGHFVRALMEAVAYLLRRHMECLAGMGIAAREVRSIGGGARSELWGQIKADVLGLPVVRLEHSEMSGLGAAVLAGVGAGVFGATEEALARAPLGGCRHEPRSADRHAYEAGYALFQRLIRHAAELDRPSVPS